MVRKKKSENVVEMLLDFLSKEGYVPSLEKEEEKEVISLKIEGLTYLIQYETYDPLFFQIICFIPIFESISKVCLGEIVERLTRKIKVVKMFATDDCVVFSAEMFLATPEDFKKVYPRAISAMKCALSNFVNEVDKMDSAQIGVIKSTGTC